LHGRGAGVLIVEDDEVLMNSLKVGLGLTGFI
jgi:hypothetical protein